MAMVQVDLEKALKEGEKANKKLEARLQKQAKALEDYKRETIENLISYFSKLKLNILLHVQVFYDPFDFRNVNLDCLDGLEQGKLGFDILYPSTPAWDMYLGGVSTGPAVGSIMPSIADEGNTSHIMNDMLCRNFFLYL